MRSVLAVLLAACVLGLPAKADRVAEVGGLRIAVAGPEKAVFVWEEDRCARDDIPDFGLRLYRRFDGQIIGFSSHQSTRRFLIDDESNFTRDCQVVHESAYDADPSRFSDATWIAATWTADGRVIHALGHNEYRADRHWFACDYETYLACWYNAIVPLRSDDGGESFVRIEGADPIASAAFPHDAHQGQPRGFFEPTNIVSKGDHLYSLIYTAGGPGQAEGTCLFRTADIADPSAWEYWDGSGFRRSSRNPYEEETAKLLGCAPLDNLDGRVSSVVRHEASGLFLASVAAQWPGMETGRVAISVSRDLTSWSKPETLLRLPLIWSSDCSDEVRYAYPTLADLNSEDRNFETVGKTPFLYMTRIAIGDCGPTMDRDLVRVPLSVGPRLSSAGGLSTEIGQEETE